MSETATLFWLQIINTSVQTVSLIFLIIYVIKTWQMASSTRKAAEATEATVNEMREARHQETAPYVIAYFDAHAASHALYLVVKNIGKSTATNVHLRFKPALINSHPDLLQQLTLLQDGIASVPPDYEIRTFLDITHEYFGHGDFPLRYEVEVSFEGGLLSETMKTTQTLDLSAMKGLIPLQRKDMHDLVTEFISFSKESKKSSQSIQAMKDILDGGIWIANPTIATTHLQVTADSWQNTLYGKLEEFRLNWTYIYKDTREKGTGILKLQRCIQSLSHQVTGIWAQSFRYAPLEIEDECNKLITLLHQMSVMRFYMGGESLKHFNALGDEVVACIERLTRDQQEVEPASL